MDTLIIDYQNGSFIMGMGDKTFGTRETYHAVVKFMVKYGYKDFMVSAAAKKQAVLGG